MNQLLEIVLTDKQQNILDLALERARQNVKSFEGTKSAIIWDAAKQLLQTIKDKKKFPISNIGKVLVNTLAKNKERSKETGISKQLVYHVLRGDEFKTLKSESHANRRIGKGKNQKSSSSNVRTNNILVLTCEEVLAQEIKKMREQYPDLPKKEIKRRISNLESIKQQFAQSTLRNAWASVLPMYQHHYNDTNSVTTVPAGLSIEAIDKQQQRQYLIAQIEKFKELITWLSGMDSAQRSTFEDHLQPGQSYLLALGNKCRDHMRAMIKMMPDNLVYIDSFIQYLDELMRLSSIFDEELYAEKHLREKKRDLASV